MERSFYILIGIILISFQSFGQITDTMSNLGQKGIFGKIETIEEMYYTVKINHEKDSLTRANYEIYSEDGFLIEKGKIETFNRKKIPETIYELKYNRNNQIEGQYKKIASDSLIPIVILRYDSLKRIAETVRFYTFIRGCSQMSSFYENDGGNYKVRRTYLYNEKGEIILCKVWDWNDKEWRHRNTDDIKNKADTKKKTIKKNQREFHPNDKKRFIEFSQKDEHGNWTIYTEFYKRKPVEIMERKINYCKM